ncbi:MAG TPA: LysM peptidoglycan-binding domain-containing protein [Burkholderiales bacterium]|nr:LysM peptidoglycan-binding domain-containing protein [Burkholderiales bacterium]
MAQRYVVKKGDTLAKIADARMGGRRQATTLADYNALRTRKLAVGSRVFIPSATDLKAARVVAVPRGAAWPAPPAGLKGVLAAFGNIFDFIRDDGTVDPRWETQTVTRVALHFSIPLDWDPTKLATGIRCHRLLAPLFTEVFRRVVDSVELTLLHGRVGT